jgi:hypothetical protein
LLVAFLSILLFLFFRNLQSRTSAFEDQHSAMSWLADPRMVVPELLSYTVT